MCNRDLELYQRLMNKDKQAFELIYDKYEKLLYSFVIKLSGDQILAEEVLQEVFIKVWTQKAVYDQTKGKFSSWIVTVTRYTAIDLIRKNKRHHLSLTEDRDLPEAGTDKTEDIVEWEEKGREIRQAVKHLSEEQKQMVNLFYFKGLSQQEIANQTSVPLGTVKGRIRLALKHLKKQLLSVKGGVHDA